MPIFEGGKTTGGDISSTTYAEPESAISSPTYPAIAGQLDRSYKVHLTYKVKNPASPV